MSHKKILHYSREARYKNLIITVFVLIIIFSPNGKGAKAVEINNVFPVLSSIQDCVNGSSDSICMKLPEIKSSVANLINTKSISKDDINAILKTVLVFTANIFLALIETIADTIRLVLLLIK